MVSVCDIHSRYLRKNLRYLSYQRFVVNHPKSMTEPIQIAYKSIFRFASTYFRYQSIQVVAMGISKEHRLDIGIIHAHMFHAVFLFIFARQLVLLDAAFHIIFHPGCNDQSVLRPAIHRLCIDVVFLFLVLHEPAVCAELLKLFCSFCIYALIVLVSNRSEVNLRFNDMV